MKTRLLIILVLCIIIAAPNAVYADALATSSNSFFDRHASDIIFLGRNFVADGEGGSVAVKKAPGSAGEIYKIENGDIVFVQYSCLYGGNYWGFIYTIPGWVRLDQMLVLYDNISFIEDHRDEFYSYEGTYDELEKTGGAIAWSWPGSGAQLWINEGMDSGGFMNSYTWKDPEGREWGFAPGYQGFSDSWVCLSDPMNGDIPAFNPPPPPEVWVSETEHVDLSKSLNPMILLVVILVAAVAIVTILIIKIIWKRSPDKKEDLGGTP